MIKNKSEIETIKKERLPRKKRRIYTLIFFTIVPIVLVGIAVGLVFMLTGPAAEQVFYEIGIEEPLNGDIVSDFEESFFPSGTSVTYTIVPQIGYKISKILVDGEEIEITVNPGEEQQVFFENIDQDHTLEAIFEIRTFGITVTQSVGGTITPSTVVKDFGSSQTFTIKPNVGYLIKSITIDGVVENIIDNGQNTLTRSISDITSSHTISAVFIPITFDITVTQSFGGTITPAGTENIVKKNYGSSQTFTIQPSVGYKIISIKIDDVTEIITDNQGESITKKLSNIKTDHSITATFAKRTLQINVSQSEGGIITLIGDGVVEYGGEQKFEIEVAEEFYLSFILLNGVSYNVESFIEGDYYILQNITQNYEISAVFTYDGIWGDSYQGICYVGDDNPTILNVPSTYPPVSSGTTVTSINLNSIPASVEVLNLPNTITRFSGEFNHLINLTTINIDSESYGSFDGALYQKDSSGNLTTLVLVPVAKTGVVLSSVMTSIRDSAFRDCSNLTSIAIPEGVTNIEYYAFYNCSKLTSIAIPEGVTNIEYHAFYNCSSLTSITIPDRVENIGYEAFSGCSNISV